MLRILLVVILLILGGAAYLWFSAQSMPDWYSENQSKEQQTIDRLSENIESQGMAKFLGDKFSDVMRGEVVFSEDEFNALVVNSLRTHEDGRRLLAVSDAVHADLRDGEIEFGAVVNIDKLGRVEPRAKQAFERAMENFPLQAGDKVFVAVVGTPIARNGNLALADNVSLKVGAIPISSALLKRVGVPVHKLNREDLPLRLLKIKSVISEEGKIRFAARPRF